MIGASRRTGTVGRAVLDNIRSGGYEGRLYAVNPHARRHGRRALRAHGCRVAGSARPRGDRCSPAGVTDVAEACGAKG